MAMKIFHDLGIFGMENLEPNTYHPDIDLKEDKYWLVNYIQEGKNKIQGITD